MKVNEEYIYGNNYSQLGLATSDENLLLNRKKYSNRFYTEDLLSKLLINLDNDFSNISYQESFLESTNEYSYDFLMRESPKAIKLNHTFSAELEVENLLSLLKQRKSNRSFKNNRFDLNDVSRILYGIGFKEGHRAYASAGGLYSISLYFYAQNIIGIDSGIYKFQPDSQTIVIIKIISLDSLSEIAQIENIENSEYIKMAGFVVVNRPQIEFKYGNRGFIFSLIEAGEMLQCLDLICEVNKYKFCQLGGYKLDKITNLLGLDGIFAFPVGMFIVGN